jgi:DNA-binding MarR family transcriptional regulator
MPSQTEALGFLVADLARMMRRAVKSRLGEDPLTYAQARALVYLSRQEGIRQVDLAEQLEIQPITLGRLVDHLAEGGLVERRADPVDRRAYRLFLTPAAAPRLAAILQVVAAVRSEALRGIDAGEAARLIEGLQRIRINLGAVREPSRTPTAAER